LIILALLALFSAITPVNSKAQTEVELGIKTSFADKIPLWMEKIGYSDSSLRDISQELDQILRTDLEFSGLFTIERGRPENTSGSHDNLSILVRGKVSSKKSGPLQDNTYFEGRVIDASTGRMIGGKRYRLRKGLKRKIAHHFADEIIKMLTGEKGIASSKIIFVRKSSDKWELVMCDYDGYDPIILLKLNRPILNPRWIENGKALVYTSFLYGKPDLFIRRLSEKSSKPLATFSGLNYSVDWSQKRKELLVTLSKDGNPEIYLFDIEKGLKKRLTYNRAIDCSPSWSPSGREIAFTSDRSGSPQIYLMESDGSNVRRLSFYGSYNSSPSWAPQGSFIAFVSRINGFFQLCTVKPDGSGLRLLTDEARNHDSPRWASDGRHIVFTEDTPSGSVISIVDINTRGRRILSQGKSSDWVSR